jgi:beta-glucosidase
MPARKKPRRVALKRAASRDVSGQFPKGFVWGVATSAYQIEGAAAEDGKGPSIWDTYAHTPGKISDGSTGDLANDHYHRFQDDVTLMASIGAQAYRFSVSWPRIFPSGTGKPNPKGLDFYSRLVDALLKAGIAPFATLYHWDLPQALEDKGGWQSRDTAKAFADYAGTVAAKLSDRVKHFFTLNEFATFIDMGYRGVEVAVGGGTVMVDVAPGLRLSDAALTQTRHNAVLAHGLSVQAIRANGKRGTQCGPAENINVAVPLIEEPAHIRAAEIATREWNAAYMTAMLEGRYTDAYLKEAGRNAPKIEAGDMKIIGAPVDFAGINIYRPAAYVLASDDAPGWRAMPFNASHPKMRSSWHILGPEALYWGPKFTQSLWKPKAIYITENGCAADDVIAPDGEIYDTDRIMYLRNSLMHLQRATQEGVRVRGCFLWSLMDNFEWGAGFANRFGIVHVDYATQKRTPKQSAAYFRAVAKRNRVM